MDDVIVLRTMRGMHPTLLPIREAAAAAKLPLSQATLARWAKAGRIHGCVRLGGRWFASAADLTASMVSKP